MRAMVLTGHGGPEKLSMAELPDPAPRAREVRVRVKA
jgi:NADPH:quinone reductase-like Zn-dependent oxidoreductase